MATSTQKVVVSSVNDIKKIIAQFDPKNDQPSPTVPISTQMEIMVDGKKMSYKLSTTTKSKSRRELVIDALGTLKKQHEALSTSQAEMPEVNGIKLPDLPEVGNINYKTTIDSLIRQWFGAYRDGCDICWDLNDGYTYKYDIFTHTLRRAMRNATN